jgi:hypothetical protein
MFWITLLVVVILIALAFAGIGIKMFVKKNGRFVRHCENEGTEYCSCKGKGGHSCKHKDLASEETK